MASNTHKTLAARLAANASSARAQGADEEIPAGVLQSMDRLKDAIDGLVALGAQPGSAMTPSQQAEMRKLQALLHAPLDDDEDDEDPHSAQAGGVGDEEPPSDAALEVIAAEKELRRRLGLPESFDDTEIGPDEIVQIALNAGAKRAGPFLRAAFGFGGGRPADHNRLAEAIRHDCPTLLLALTGLAGEGDEVAERSLATLDDDGASLAHLAASHGGLSLVAALMASDGDLARQADDRGWLPLHSAAASGSIASIPLLLHYHPDALAQPTADGFTPLMLAAGSPNALTADAVEILILAGAPFAFDEGDVRDRARLARLPASLALAALSAEPPGETQVDIGRRFMLLLGAERVPDAKAPPPRAAAGRAFCEVAAREAAPTLGEGWRSRFARSPAASRTTKSRARATSSAESPRSWPAPWSG